MQWLAQLSIRRPVFATVLILLVTVFGAISYGKLGLDYFPNVDLPIVVVTTVLPGAAAEEMEADVSDKLEASINTIGGLEELRSTSAEGLSIVVAQFKISKDSDVAAQEVRDKVSLVTQDLPSGIDPPVISKIDPGAAPVLFLALRSNRPVREVTELADKVVRRQLETIDGVGEVLLVGGRKREIQIELDPLALRSFGVTVAEVQGAVAQQNLTVPGGSLESGPEDVTLRIAGRVTSPDAIGRIVVRTVDGHPIRVSDVARVLDGAEAEESAARFDGETTVVLQIKKQSGKNTVAVVDGVLARFPDVEKVLPAGVSLEVVYDNSGVIRTSTHAVLEHLVLGAVLASIIVLLFLGSGRSTLIASLAIPISIVGTFAVMYLFGFTLNFLTLLALALAVGLVIDDAIVVIENVMSFIERHGYKPFPAALLGTREIGLAVLATTLALMSVFLPIAFMDGIIGMFLRSFGLTMASAIGVSLFVSFTLTPMLAARLLKAHDPNAKPGLLSRVVDGFYKPIEKAYVAALRVAMRFRWAVLLLCVAALASMIPVGKQLTGGFLPVNDKAQFQVRVRAPEGTSVAETALIADRVAQDVAALPGITHTLVTVGADDQKTANVADIRVLMSDPNEREVTQSAIMQRTREEILPRLPASLRVAVQEVPDIGGAGGSNAPIQYAIQGPDLAELTRIARHVVEALREVPGAVDVDTTYIDGKPELRVIIDREAAADLGVKVSDVASSLRVFVGGAKISTYAEEGQQYDVIARADPRYRVSEDSLALFSVPSTKHGSVPLTSVVKTTAATGPSTIERLARSRQITITAASAPGVGDTVVQNALLDIAKASLPAGYRIAPVGATKSQGETTAAFGVAFVMMFLLVYMVLAAQFESWLEPLVVLAALPLTVPFGLLSLLIFEQSINMFSMLGLLVLLGVVQKNAVLQIDHTKQLMAAGKSMLEATIEANRDRLRPILMTTLAFVAGMAPLVVSRGVGAGFNQAMSGIVVGGQAMSLVLTLLATPVIFSLALDFTALLRRILPKGRTDAETGKLELEAIVRGEPHETPAH